MAIGAFFTNSPKKIVFSSLTDELRDAEQISENNFEFNSLPGDIIYLHFGVNL